MCGLNYTYGSDKQTIDLMNTTIAHRGTQPGKTLKIGRHNFGHVRLPIQGLDERFDQPYRYHELTFIFVGEIYNYRDFRLMNGKLPDSDIEVLAHQFYTRGSNCLYEFDWMGHFIVHDSDHPDSVRLFTDILSKKPVYLHSPSGSVSSEIKALSPMAGGQFDELYFSTVRKFGYRYDNRTPYRDIHSIPPRSEVRIRKGRVTECRQYETYRPDRVPRGLRQKLSQAVKNRMVSDKPIAILLSGGLDSSIIYKLALEHDKHLNLYHVDNGEEEFLDYLKIPDSCSLTKISAGDNVDEQELLRWNEGPVDLGSVIPQLNLAKEINLSNFQVVLSGDGADELFGGYQRAQDYDSQYSDIYDELVYYHLPRLDKLMMSQTIELRCPFLARSVLDYALNLPWHRRRSKESLKSAFADLLPNEIIDRPKRPLKSSQVREQKLDWVRHLCDLYQTQTDFIKPKWRLL